MQLFLTQYMPRPFVQIIVFVSLCFPFFLLWNDNANAFTGEVPGFVEEMTEGNFFSVEESTQPFFGHKAITRGDFLQWSLTLYPFYPDEYADTHHPFVDIEKGDVLYPYVSAGYAAGALDIFEADGKFLPNRALTRMQALELFFGLYVAGSFTETFKELPEVVQDMPQDVKKNQIVKYALVEGFIESNNGFVSLQEKMTRRDAAFLLYMYVRGQEEYIYQQEQSTAANDEYTTVEYVEDIIESNYWKAGDVENNQLEDAALTGMVESLDDPYSVYLAPDQSDAFTQYFNEDPASDNTEYAGLGVAVQEATNGGLVITEIFPGSPAEEIQMKEGDIIVGVDGEDMRAYSVNEIVAAIVGPVGTRVSITFVRNGKEKNVSFVRRTIEVTNLSSVVASTVDNIVWIKVRSFKAFTARDFEDALRDNVTDTTRGVIVDLRYNSGGIMESAQKMLGEILDENSVAVALYSNAGVEEFLVDGSGDFTEIPLVVFQNEYSASASEIFSAAVQDYDRGDIIGTTSYGKGIAQSIFILDRGSLKLTTAEFRSPLGNIIHGLGISPDREMKSQDDSSYLYEAKKAFQSQ